VFHKRPTKRPWPTRLKNPSPSHPDELRKLGAALRQESAAAAALDEIARAVAEGEPGRETLGEIADLVRRATKTDAAQFLILQPDGETLRLEADTYEPEKVGRIEIAVGKGLTGWVAKHRRPVAIRREPWKDPRFIDYPVLEERRFQSILSVPLVSGNELLGVVNVRTYRQYGYTDQEARLLGRIAGHVARAIRHQTKVATLETRAERYKAVTEVTELIAASPYLEEILQLLVSFTAERLNYKVVTVRLLDEERNELVLRATQSTHYAYRKKRSIAVGESFAGRAVLERKTVTVADVLQSPEYIGADMAAEQGLRSMASVPLLIRDKVIGVMTCYTDDVHAFGRVELQALEALAKQAAIAIEHAKLQVRTTLMQEMHHRVKNNLQQVVSLLRLQLSQAGWKTTTEVIEDTLSRIQAIAAVHELLSREDLDRVGILTVAQTLAAIHQQALVLPSKQIQIRVEGDEVPLSLNQATQVALIINELLQNSVEHGFKVVDEGEIEISIKFRDNLVTLWVANSGDRLPEGFSLAASTSIGLRIVESLAKAVGGRFRLIERYGWVLAEITFPREQAESG
jgi:two-component sensor histidine kinase